MIVYTENYGADADGNRGRMITEYEIEPSDREAIEEQVAEQLNGYDECDYPETMLIKLICPFSEEDIEFEIDTKDYL